MAWHPDGGLVFSLGENFGKDWTLTARMARRSAAAAKAASFAARADGSGCAASRADSGIRSACWCATDGEIFAADNDPGSRPPAACCNIVEGADYGFQWVYGSAPVHPFVAWNGELRGTLRMVHPSRRRPVRAGRTGRRRDGPLVEQSLHRLLSARRAKARATRRSASSCCAAAISSGPSASRGTGRRILSDRLGLQFLSDLTAAGACGNWRSTKPRRLGSKPAPDPMNDAARLAKDLREGKAKLTTAQLFEHARGSDAYLSDAALTALARESAAWTPDSLRAHARQGSRVGAGGAAPRESQRREVGARAARRSRSRGALRVPALDRRRRAHQLQRRGGADARASRISTTACSKPRSPPGIPCAAIPAPA